MEISSFDLTVNYATNVLVSKDVCEKRQGNGTGLLSSNNRYTISKRGERVRRLKEINHAELADPR